MRTTTLDIEWNHKQYFIGPKEIGKEKRNKIDMSLLGKNRKILNFS